ncbi:hypothetical protein ACIPUC_00065 [Streptomyces sp. LARHCF249]
MLLPEGSAHRGERANTFWLLRHQGLSVQEAVDYQASRIIQAQDAFCDLATAILSSPLGMREDVRRYIDAISYAVGGNLHWHRIAPRYWGADHDGTPMHNGTVTITEHGTTFKPTDQGLFHK